MQVIITKLRNKREKRFGIQIDSLSDLISFGVLPAMFLYGISGHNRVAGVIGAMYVLCAIIRRAYFNVLEEERQSRNPGDVKIYLGVPVTVIAVLLPVEYMMYEKGLLNNSFCFAVLLLVMSLCFLAPIEIKKPGLAGKVCLIVVGLAELIGVIFKAGLSVL